MAAFRPHPGEEKLVLIYDYFYFLNLLAFYTFLAANYININCDLVHASSAIFSFHVSLFYTVAPSIKRIALQGGVSNFKTLLKKKLSKIYMFIYNKSKYVKLIELGGIFAESPF